LNVMRDVFTLSQALFRISVVPCTSHVRNNTGKLCSCQHVSA
jgi:hypothetical protein